VTTTDHARVFRALGLHQTSVYAGTITGGFCAGWLADRLVRRFVAGRVVIQAVGVLCGAPFIFLCCQTHSMSLVLVSLAAWGFFKGLYDANIFASLFDAVPVAGKNRTCMIIESLFHKNQIVLNNCLTFHFL
jgi:MFS family permease